MVVTVGVEDGGARTLPDVDGDDEDQNAIRFRSKQVHTKAFQAQPWSARSLIISPTNGSGLSYSRGYSRGCGMSTMKYI